MTAPETPPRATIRPVEGLASRPLWSVMIPTHNSGAHLREALASVLEQDLGAQQMQIEVVDDGSTEDDPEQIVNELGGGRVTLFRQSRNVGYIDNFETCLQRSRGEFVHLLHGDDLVRNGFYKALQRVLEAADGVGAAFCRTIYMDREGHWLFLTDVERPTAGVLDQWLERLARRQRVATPSMVVRRSVYERLGGFDRRIRCCGEDWEMWVRIAASYKTAFVPEPLALYRYKPIESLSTEHIRRIMQDMLLATQMVRDHLTGHLTSSDIAQVARSARTSFATWPLAAIRTRIAEGAYVEALTLLRAALAAAPSIGQQVDLVVDSVATLLRARLASAR